LTKIKIVIKDVQLDKKLLSSKENRVKNCVRKTISTQGPISQDHFVRTLLLRLLFLVIMTKIGNSIRRRLKIEAKEQKSQPLLPPYYSERNRLNLN
jgi:hypothetical protein